MKEALARLKTDKAALLQALCAAGTKTDGDVSHIRCPFHAGGLDESSGSLSVFEDSSDHSWRWRCHKCDDGGDIVDVVAKTERIENGAAIKRTLERFGQGCPPPPRAPEKKSEKKRTVYASIADASDALVRFKGGECTRQDVYLDGEGRDTMAVLRLDVPGKGKMFWPLHRESDGWVVGDPPGKLPVFHWDRLTAFPDKPVVVCEGEKCAEILEEYGFLSVTSAHGAKSANKTDWSPLAGRDVTIWPDHDTPGTDYRDAVTAILTALNPPAHVKWVDTLRLDPPEGWDAADYVKEMQNRTFEQIQTELQNVVASAQPAPRRWAGGVDLDECLAASRLADGRTFEPRKCMPTGYAQLDKALGGGWGDGEATTLFAPSSMGKSVLMVNLALAAARQGNPTFIISLEMRESDIWQLATAIVAGLPRLHVRQGTMTDAERERFQRAIAEISQWPLFVMDRSRFPIDPEHPEAPTMSRVGAVLKDAVERCGIRLAFIDYLTKVGPFGDDDLTRYPKLTNWAFDLAQRLGIHWVCLAQSGKSSWGRTDEDGHRTVSLEDAKGAIEVIADFDNAIGLVRDDWNTEEPQESPYMRAVVLKARQAGGGVCQLVFHRLTGQIEEVLPQDRPAAKAMALPAVSRRLSAEEETALFKRSIPAKPAPKAVIVLNAEKLGLSNSRADSLLAQAVHDGSVKRARINGEYLYALSQEALDQVAALDSSEEAA